MIGHPGDDERETLLFQKKLSQLKNIEQFQLFTPILMTLSSCMYWTGLNSFTKEKIIVVYDYNTKKKIKRILLGVLEEKKRR